MLHYYLAPYTGAGTAFDPYRPAVEQPQWSAIDRRADARAPEGYALVAVPERERGLIDLGDGGPARSHGRVLARRFGLARLPGFRFGDVIAALLMRQGAWPRPTVEGRYEIWLGGLLWSMPVLAGGAIADTFVRANQSGLGTSSEATWSWTTYVLASWSIVSNSAAFISTGESNVRADQDLSSADHEVQATLLSFVRSGGFITVGVIGRKDSTATETKYLWRAVNDGATAGYQLFKSVAGTYTQLGGSHVVTPTTNDVLKLKCNGSNISGFLNTVEQVGPITDATPITGNVRAGFYGNSNDINNSASFGSFSATELGGPAVPEAGAYHQTLLRARGWGRWT